MPGEQPRPSILYSLAAEHVIWGPGNQECLVAVSRVLLKMPDLSTTQTCLPCSEFPGDWDITVGETPALNSLGGPFRVFGSTVGRLEIPPWLNALPVRHTS